MIDEDLNRLTELPERGRFFYKALSGKKYLIEVGAERIRCGCADFMARRNGRTTWCKHIIGGKGEIGLVAILGWKLVRAMQQQEKELESR